MELCKSMNLNLLAMWLFLPLRSCVKGRTPLHKAAYRGHCCVAELLLSKGASTDVLDGIGWGLKGDFQEWWRFSRAVPFSKSGFG